MTCVLSYNNIIIINILYLFKKKKMNLIFGFLVAILFVCGHFLPSESVITSSNICSNSDYCALLLNRIIPVDSQVYAVTLDSQQTWNLPQGHFYLSVNLKRRNVCLPILKIITFKNELFFFLFYFFIFKFLDISACNPTSVDSITISFLNDCFTNLGNQVCAKVSITGTTQLYLDGNNWWATLNSPVQVSQYQIPILSITWDTIDNFVYKISCTSCSSDVTLTIQCGSSKLFTLTEQQAIFDASLSIVPNVYGTEQSECSSMSQSSQFTFLFSEVPTSNLYVMNISIKSTSFGWLYFNVS